MAGQEGHLAETDQEMGGTRGGWRAEGRGRDTGWTAARGRRRGRWAGRNPGRFQDAKQKDFRVTEPASECTGLGWEAWKGVVSGGW